MENGFKLNDEQLKAQVAKQYKKTELKFPTEIIDLPSKGLVYPEGHPLRDGRVEMKYMTAKEEDILSSQSLIKKGIVLDRLFQSLIIGNGEGAPFDYDDLVVGDKNAVMVAARVLGYGKDYDVEINIPQLDEPHRVTVDLTQLNDKEFDAEVFEKHGNNIPFELPVSKNVVTLKILNGKDEKSIDHVLKGKRGQIERTNSTRLKYIITSVDGDSERKTIDTFVDEYLLSQDSLAIKKYIVEIQPDVDLRVKVDIPDEDISEFFDIPIGLSFFWPRV
jgi:hypothetical protein|tara:strand:+ start:944 stop:1771 length:828 start_codon:yes stop_codon:yes gene_type:complete